LNKINHDGYLNQLKELFSVMLDHEIKFAIDELVKFDNKIVNSDFKTQLTNNTYIFKENLKEITHYLR